MGPPRASGTLAKGIASLGSETDQEPNPGAKPTSLPGNEKSLRDAASADPGNFAANLRLGKWLVDNGRARDGIPYLQRASELLASLGANSPSKGGKDEAEPHHLLGEAQEKLGNPLDAVREYQRAAELDASEANLFDWGSELLLHRAIEPAIEVFGKGNRLFPTSRRMLVGLGVAWYSRGSYEEAAARLCKATDSKPDDPTPYPFLSNTLNPDSANAEGIVERLARFAQLQPENALASYYYAVGLWKLRKGPQDHENLERIRALLEKAERLDPKLGAAHMQLGLYYSEMGDVSRAIAAYQKAVAATPQLPEAHYRLAQAYRQAKQTTKARQELEVFKRVSKEAEDEDERERREIKRFVYTMQDSRPRQ